MNFAIVKKGDDVQHPQHNKQGGWCRERAVSDGVLIKFDARETTLGGIFLSKTILQKLLEKINAKGN